jgi:hypothetical protein
MRTVSATLNTVGDGLWSLAQRAITITAIDVPYTNKEGTFGELRIYFDPDTWPTQELGLIYTDGQFMRELRELLDSMGYSGRDVDYSEQGMQGSDYVSCDVGVSFLDSYPSKWIRHDQAHIED